VSASNTAPSSVVATRTTFTFSFIEISSLTNSFRCYGERGRVALGCNSSLPDSEVLPASVDVLDCFSAVLVLDSSTASSQRFLESSIVRNSDRVLYWSIDCAIDNRLSENYPVLDFLIFDCSRVVTELDSSLTAIALEIDFVVTVVAV